jgi:hypothetical protein
LQRDRGPAAEINEGVGLNLHCEVQHLLLIAEVKVADVERVIGFVLWFAVDESVVRSGSILRL